MYTRGKEYVAYYPFELTGIPEHHIDLMVWYLVHGFGENPTCQVREHFTRWPEQSVYKLDTYEEVEIPVYEQEGLVIESLDFFKEKIDKATEGVGPKKLLSFSGGRDSVCTKTLLPESICVFLKRQTGGDEYDSNQLEVVKETNAYTVLTNFHDLRALYGKGLHGFNHTHGYAALLIPFLSALGANEIMFGAPLEDIGFHRLPNKISTFGRHSFTENGFDICAMLWMRRAGIEVSFPIAGISEVLTTRIVEQGKYKGLASSCHIETGKKDCGQCEKCYRKLPLLGREQELSHQAFIAGEHRVNDKPMKMVFSLVYSTALLPPSRRSRRMNELSYWKVDFAERMDPWHIKFFNPEDTAKATISALNELGIQPMSATDQHNLNQFMRQLNRPYEQ